MQDPFWSLSLSSRDSPNLQPLQDYNITFYCAEAVNTFTNLVFMWLGLKGLWNVCSYGHSRVFILVFLGYMVIGLGSMAFHTTLKCQFCPPCVITCLCLCLAPAFFFLTLCVFLLLSYTPSPIADEMQLADELPMIYTVCIMAYAAFSYRRSARVQALIAAALVGLAVFITVCASISDTVLTGG